MKILQVHNLYRQRTGEESIIEEEKSVLEKNGHQVIQFFKDNSRLDDQPILAKAGILFNLRGSRNIEKELDHIIQKERPDICHVHNTFPLITPSVFKVCYDFGIPVVKSLHNYKMVCTQSTLFRNGEVCTSCLNKSLYNSIKYKCYRDSYLATAFQADIIQHHRKIGTWINHVDLFLALTDFQKNLITEGGGLPKNKVIVKPNFVSSREIEASFEDFYLFIGKVEDYKGLEDLLKVIENNPKSNFVVIGAAEDGLFDRFENVNYLGHQPKDIVMSYLERCKTVLFLSKNFEGMPMVILEAFSMGKPVICRNIGAMSTMITHNYNGFHYNFTDELTQLISKLDYDLPKLKEMGANAFRDYQTKYSQEVGYKNLIQVYNNLIALKS